MWTPSCCWRILSLGKLYDSSETGIIETKNSVHIIGEIMLTGIPKLNVPERFWKTINAIEAPPT